MQQKLTLNDMISSKVPRYKLQNPNYASLQKISGVRIFQKGTKAKGCCKFSSNYTIQGTVLHSIIGGELYNIESYPQCLTYDIFCLGSCQPLELHFQDTKTKNSTVFKIKKPQSCSCLWFKRPKFDILEVERNVEQIIGSIVEEYGAFYGPSYVIRDEKGKEQFRIEGRCCQIGLWCKGPFDKCQVIQFDIRDQDYENNGNIVKQVGFCCQNDAQYNNFSIFFAKNSHPKKKLMLMAASVLIEHLLFGEISYFD